MRSFGGTPGDVTSALHAQGSCAVAEGQTDEPDGSSSGNSPK